MKTKTGRMAMASVFLSGLACGVGAQQTAPAAHPAQGKWQASAPAPKPIIEARAMALLKKSQQAMVALHSYQAECQTTVRFDRPEAGKPAVIYDLSTLFAAKPNKMRYDRWRLTQSPLSAGWVKPKTPPKATYACDGTTHWKQFGTTYRMASSRPEYLSTGKEPWTGFYMTFNSPYSLVKVWQEKGELRRASFVGREAVNGVLCDKVRVVSQLSYQGVGMGDDITYYFGQDGLVRRSVQHVTFADRPGRVEDAVLLRLRPNAPTRAAIYAYTPPAGVTLVSEKPEAEPALLANGTNAPDFTAADSSGNPVKLSDYRGKVVVLDFWASWCPPCKASMPHNQEVTAKLQAEGLPVVLLAVDDAETHDDFAAWVQANATGKYPALTFVYSDQKADISSKLFKVTGIPTQYVIDRDGMVRASYVGFGGPTDDLEKAVRAALADANLPAVPDKPAGK